MKWIVPAAVAVFTLSLCGCSSDSGSDNTNQIAKSSVSQASTTATNNSTSSNFAGLPFTVETFREDADGLSKLEPLGEFKQTEKFACDFTDGTGTVTGEYIKANRRIEHLAISGKGDTWNSMVRRAIALANPGSSIDDILSQLQGAAASESPVNITVGDTAYSAFEVPAMGATTLLMRNAHDPENKPSLEGPNAPVTPDMGTTLSSFKQAFNRRMMDIAPSLKLNGNGEPTTSETYFCYPFTKETILHVYTDEKMQVNNIELDSVAKDAGKYWNCTDAVLAALSPGESQASRNALLAELGKQNDKGLPRNSADFDHGDLHFNYDFTRNVGALTIQSNRP
jgi:hypothetical protein